MIGLFNAEENEIVQTIGVFSNRSEVDQGGLEGVGSIPRLERLIPRRSMFCPSVMGLIQPVGIFSFLDKCPFSQQLRGVKSVAAKAGSIEPAWLESSAQFISSETGLTIQRSKEILLGAEKKNNKSRSISGRVRVGRGEGLSVERIRPVVDVLVAEFGSHGAAEILDLRGSLLRWYPFGDRLQILIGVLKELGVPQDTVVKDFLIVKRTCAKGGVRKRGLLELGVTAESVKATIAFLQGDGLSCSNAEIAELFSKDPNLFAMVSNNTREEAVKWQSGQ